MNESRAAAIVIDLFKLDEKFCRIVLRVSEDLGSEESDYVVGDDLNGLVLKVRVVDTEMVVEPADFVRY